MITLKNVKTIEGAIVDYRIDGPYDVTIDGDSRLTLLPALIDPHVHFRIPGADHKETWHTGARAALAGGVTMVFDMPNNMPACTTVERAFEKKTLIDSQLQQVGIPLRYGLFLGADQNHLEEIPRVQGPIIGIKVFMGSSTGELLMTEKAALDEVFRLAAEHDFVVAVHAEDEERLRSRKQLFHHDRHPAVHSRIRDRQAAANALSQAIELAAKYGTRLYALHLSTIEEMSLIREAKGSGVTVTAETTPHHLFLNEQAYNTWGTKVQVNPPIRTADDQVSVWAAIVDGTIDIIGSDHAPHTLEEKNHAYPHSPSGMPGVETRLPLLLHACNSGRLDLQTVARLTRTNIEKLFRLQPNDDVVLVDMEVSRVVTDDKLQTACGWSPFTGRTLRGWPLYTILKGQLYDLRSPDGIPRVCTSATVEGLATCATADL